MFTTVPEASLLIARSLKLLAEIALFAWLGQLVLGALLGARRNGNVIHGLFEVVLRPLRWLAEHGLPATWSLRSRRIVAAMLLFVLWALALAWKVHLCRSGAACH